MTITPSPHFVLERQLMLQFGDRLKRLRKAQGLSAVEVAKRAGISRNTLRSIEAGDTSPSLGTYMGVMATLGVSGELAMLAGDTWQPAPAGSAGARSRRAVPLVRVTVSVDPKHHQLQDLQSLALHDEAVRCCIEDPRLVEQACETLQRWQAGGSSNSVELWRKWAEILAKRNWRVVLGKTRRAQQLRQASPLVTVLPDEARERVLAQVRELRHGIRMDNADAGTLQVKRE